MVKETKGSYVFPRELENLKEPITAYDALNSRIIITKNGIIRAMGMLFPGLSGMVDLNLGTIRILKEYRAPYEFPNEDGSELTRHIKRKGIDRIMRAAESAPHPG